MSTTVHKPSSNPRASVSNNGLIKIIISHTLSVKGISWEMFLQGSLKGKKSKSSLKRKTNDFLVENELVETLEAIENSSHILASINAHSET